MRVRLYTIATASTANLNVSTFCHRIPHHPRIRWDLWYQRVRHAAGLIWGSKPFGRLPLPEVSRSEALAFAFDSCEESGASQGAFLSQSSSFRWSDVRSLFGRCSVAFDTR